jgi:hypothetical protein
MSVGLPLAGELTSAERLVADAFPDGKVVDLPLAEDERTVRAAVISRLVAGASRAADSLPALRIIGARFTGRLELDGAAITVPIELEQCLFEEAVSLADVQALTIRLPGCQLPGLHAPGLETRGDLDLNDGFICTGQVNLLGARVGDALRLSTALLHSPGGRALVLSRATVSSAILASGLVVNGQMRMISTRVGGLLSIRGGKLSNPGQIALYGERMDVGESILLTKDFSCRGRVVLQNARIAGGLDGQHCSIAAPGMTCLNLVRAKVERNVGLAQAELCGKVTLSGAAIGGRVTFTEAIFKKDDSSELVLDHAQAQVLVLRYSEPPASLSLRYATADIIEDNPSTWPAKISLIGCTYRALESTVPVTVFQRLSWLTRDTDGYRPQPYEQLIKTYRLNGEEQNAKRVALQRERTRRQALSWPGRALGIALDLTVGYGYRTWLAGIWLLTFLAAGTAVFSIWPAQPVSHNPPAFQPFVFTLDLMLPIVNLGQKEYWQAAGPVRWFGWVLVLVGWGLTTAVVAGVTRLFNRS